MTRQKGAYTRRSIFSGTRPYMWYAEDLKKYTNTVDGTFYDAIIFNILYITYIYHLFNVIFNGFRAAPSF
jgi:hypothetical protein